MRAWQRALPQLDPVCGPTLEAEERAAIEAEVPPPLPGTPERDLLDRRQRKALGGLLAPDATPAVVVEPGAAPADAGCMA